MTNWEITKLNWRKGITVPSPKQLMELQSLGHDIKPYIKLAVDHHKKAIEKLKEVRK